MAKLAVPCVLILVLVAALWAAEKKPPVTEITIPTADGFRTLKGKEAEAYTAACAWMEARMQEAASVRVGSTHAEVFKHFRHDGGLTMVGKSRLVLILCPYIKIDVEFEAPKGAKAGAPLPGTAKVSKVSKPYFEREYCD
jgi:hypothetical protein